MNCLGRHRIGKPDERVTVVCGAEITNGLALCELCQRKAMLDLEFLPVYFRNLARWRPGGTGGRQVPGSREPRSVGETNDRVAVAMNAAGNTIVTWAKVLVDDRPQLAPMWARLEAADIEEDQVIAWVCRGFERYLISVATLGWCGEFVADIAEIEEELRRLTEHVAPGWYAGACKRCESSTYVVPGLTWVTCGGCGTTSFARDHIEVILTEARGWVAPPRRIAEALVALLDTEQSIDRLHDRIRQWSHRETLESVRRFDADGDPIGIKRYHLGHVLDRLLTEGATRIDTVVVVVADVVA